MGGKEDWFENGMVSFLNTLEDFDGDEEELFVGAKFVIVEIVSKGCIRQDEFGLCDEDSTYKSRRAAQFFLKIIVNNRITDYSLDTHKHLLAAWAAFYSCQSE